MHFRKRVSKQQEESYLDIQQEESYLDTQQAQ